MPKTSELPVPFPGVGAVLADRPSPELPIAWSNLSSAFLSQARRTPDKLLVADSSGQRATYKEALLRAVGMTRVLRRRSGQSPFFGIMIPPSVAGTLANLAVSLMGKSAVNLNYALSEDIPNSAIEQCGIDTVLTSKRVLDKNGFNLDARVILIEDIARQATAWDKGMAWLLSNLTPRSLLAHQLPGLSASLDDVATIMFTSGSTGDSKGVILSQRNILSNIAQVRAHARLTHAEVVLGKLPYFHSYGFTGTLWAVACLGMTVVCHHNPLDPRAVGKLMEDYKVTVMASTPTLMRSYLKRCTPEQFASVRWLQLGSEKLKPELAADIEAKLRVKPVEGYGATEMSPGVSSCINLDVETVDGRTVSGNRPGSVGQLFPGTAAAVVDLETGKLLPRGRGHEGLLFFSGPQVMQGYLGKPEETDRVLQNGWYCSGDIGCLDEDGFLYITDRLSRFAKVGGEMVPIILVEAAIRQLACVDELSVAIAAVPDQAKGEKLVVLYTTDDLHPEDVVAGLKQSGINNLWIPRAADFHKVESFPTAATGKLDLKSIKKMALLLCGPS